MTASSAHIQNSRKVCTKHTTSIQAKKPLQHLMALWKEQLSEIMFKNAESYLAWIISTNFFTPTYFSSVNDCEAISIIE
jgi:hypothetical protein